MSHSIRIGTRKSPLALWQAEQVAEGLAEVRQESKLVLMESLGDLNLTDPLNSLGETGVFTKTLDLALLDKKIDCAVHSLKDVATQVPEGLVLAACLKRGPKRDVLLNSVRPNPEMTIATGSPRRKAQWLHKFPNYGVEGLRGNVQTRIQKIHDSTWEGGIMAEAGLERMGLDHLKHEVLNWMYPAPSQGIVAVFCRVGDEGMFDALNHPQTMAEAKFERAFLRALEGGCAAPIGVKLEKNKDKTFQADGVLVMPDGSKAAFGSMEAVLKNPEVEGVVLAKKVLEAGGEWIMHQIRRAE